MALTVKTEVTDTLNEHYISDYSAFLDDDNDFYLIDNDSGDFIVQLNEAEGLHIADGAGPAAHGDLLAAEDFSISKEGCNFYSFHIPSPFPVL